VIVADCTGHGIPGALMSIIANDALNRIIVQEENTAPAKILHLLNEYVTSTLQKNDTVSEDGLDIAVCTLCSSEKTIRYAGAKNSLYYVRNSELHEIKASKHSIGGLSHDITKEFVEHSFAFEPTDKFYMCSDGFADQLGGPFGKKFLGNRLRSLLFETANEPFLAQQQVFASAHNAWRGQNKQTDDITILGFSPLES
jgi:serine phosphatase RsbU (regulator of sigma subunit)